ncbi:MAG: mono/diheme cytochrome c family protein [Acidimicrobiales bacterium]|jgi:mono/diheme cytochrome c family protein
MKTTSMFAGLVIALTVALPACGGDDPVAAPLESLVPLAAEADGATIYQARCASCHGEDLRGTSKGPSQLSIVYEPNHHGDDSYRSAIRNGAPQHHWSFGDMPAVEDITDGQIEQVITYIRTQQQALGFEQ